MQQHDVFCVFSNLSFGYYMFDTFDTFDINQHVPAVLGNT